MGSKGRVIEKELKGGVVMGKSVISSSKNSPPKQYRQTERQTNIMSISATKYIRTNKAFFTFNNLIN